MTQAAIDLARFLVVLRGINAESGPRSGRDNHYRGVALRHLDSTTRSAMENLANPSDRIAAGAAWDAALRAPEWDRAACWVHGDLHSGNLLARNGRLSAVIDFGLLGVGDPACDVMVAWTFFSGAAREAFREALQVDDATWSRARGWALFSGAIALRTYAKTNLILARNARRWIDEVLSDQRESHC
jgi:aminoglycoside phosphotransferase (APT) family kinase protein